MNNRTKNAVFLAPSILPANFSNLESEIRQLEEGGADWIHIDVMDGHFVPSITFGPIIVQTVRNLTDLTLDVHLMMKEPDKYLEEFRTAGADIITVHQEVCPHLNRTINYIHDLGAKAGVSLNPGTHVASLEEIVSKIDLVLIMSVNPGFGGQQFIHSSLEKIKKTRALLQSNQSAAHLEVDGGIDTSNIRSVVEAGCNVIVAGTGIFKNTNRAAGVRNLRKAALNR